MVLDAQGLTTEQMQAIAREFNYSETTFLLPPRALDHAAQVRIFTPHTEVPFAGHPNIGTAVVLARELAARDGFLSDRITFEEAAGLVSIRLWREAGSVIGAELTAPAPLSRYSCVSAEDVAACLSLKAADISLRTHVPQVISVGLPFLVAELASRDALRRAKPNWLDHQRVLPPIDTDAVFAYVGGAAAEELAARMFAPLDGIIEDPATGSATAATIALLAQLRTEKDEDVAWRIEQGIEMGRPSLLLGRTEKKNGVVQSVHVGGRAVLVRQGWIRIS